MNENQTMADDTTVNVVGEYVRAYSEAFHERFYDAARQLARGVGPAVGLRPIERHHVGKFQASRTYGATCDLARAFCGCYSCVELGKLFIFDEPELKKSLETDAEEVASRGAR